MRAGDVEATLLVTGATGLVGSCLLAELARAKRRVRVVARDPSARPGAPGASWVRGDLADRASLRAACVGVDTVLHCAARLEGTPDEVEATNARGTQRLLEEAVRAGVRRFVHVSSSAVYRDGPMCRAAEDYPRGGGSPYAASKQCAEDAVLAAARDLEVVVLRPSAIYGPGDRYFLPLLAALARHHAIALTPGGGARMSLVHAADVARAIVVAAAVPVDRGDAIFNLAGEPAAPIGAYLDLVARALEVEVERFEIPVDLPLGPEPPPVWATLTAGLCRPPLPWHLVPAVLHERSLDTTAARERLGFGPEVSPETGIPAALESLPEGARDAASRSA